MFKTQHRKTKCMYIKKVSKTNRTKDPEQMRWPLLVSEHFSLLHLTIFYSVLPCGFIIIITTIILSVFGPCAQYQDGMSETINKQTKINKCCRCYGDGGQIHGRVWEGVQHP